MNSKDRVFAVLNGEIPDRIPISLLLNFILYSFNWIKITENYFGY